ncbi:hypothetical protein VNO77_24447 [Canavalia gladiata]|uniref:Uncharacterized protein n=1 Tax=Canavalia gladiata TaxID=3824 RepID=A0AAN9QCR1_CANGL
MEINTEEEGGQVNYNTWHPTPRLQFVNLLGKKLSSVISKQKISMELWNKARSFAEESAKRSQELSFRASKLSDMIASKHLPEPSSENNDDLQRFGITQHLREFVKGITITTFQHFPLQVFFFFRWT